MSNRRAELERKAEAKQEKERRDLIKRCAIDPMFWLTHMTMTEDVHASSKDGKERNPVKPFPDKDYMYAVAAYFYMSDRLFLPKSRTMMTSYLIMGLLTHVCQFYKATEAVVQCENETKANDVLNYARVLYKYQPQWLRERYPLTTDSKQSKKLVSWVDYGKFHALPGGPTQLRSYHPLWVAFDEAAYITDFDACYQSAQQCAKRIVAISSAQPSEFGQVCEMPTDPPVPLGRNVREMYYEATKEFFGRLKYDEGDSSVRGDGIAG